MFNTRNLTPAQKQLVMNVTVKVPAFEMMQVLAEADRVNANVDYVVCENNNGTVKVFFEVKNNQYMMVNLTNADTMFNLFIEQTEWEKATADFRRNAVAFRGKINAVKRQKHNSTYILTIIGEVLEHWENVVRELER